MPSWKERFESVERALGRVHLVFWLFGATSAITVSAIYGWREYMRQLDPAVVCASTVVAYSLLLIAFVGARKVAGSNSAGQSASLRPDPGNRPLTRLAKWILRRTDLIASYEGQLADLKDENGRLRKLLVQWMLRATALEELASKK